MMHAFSSTLAGGAPSSLPPALSVPGVKLALCRPGRRAESLTVVKAQKKPITEADLYMGVDTIPQPEPAPQGTPWYISVPVGFVAVIAVLRTIKALTRRRCDAAHCLRCAL